MSVARRTPFSAKRGILTSQKLTGSSRQNKSLAMRTNIKAKKPIKNVLLIRNVFKILTDLKKTVSAFVKAV
jgi:hypothetical protein